MYISDGILLVYYIMKKWYFLIVVVVFSASIMIISYDSNPNNLMKSQMISTNILIPSSDLENNSKNLTSQLPIYISSKDFVNGIHFTDLNAIEGVSQGKVIVIDGILEYVD